MAAYVNEVYVCLFEQKHKNVYCFDFIHSLLVKIENRLNAQEIKQELAKIVSS